jgi:Cache domain
MHLRQVHEQVEIAANQEARTLARSVEENVVRTVEAVDQALRFLQAIHRRDPAGFDLPDWSSLYELGDGLAVQLAQIGADGIMVASDRNRGGAPVNLADREHFRVHLGSDQDRLFISKPVLGRVSKQWTIQFTRPLRMADGSFAGVLVISVSASQLFRVYDSLQLSGGSLLLVGDDGVIRARAPRQDGALGERAADRVLDRIGRSGEGSYGAASSLDGVERIFSYRRVRGQPLTVFVGLGAASAFASYDRERRRGIQLGGVLTFGLLAFGALILRQTARIDGSEKALSGWT